MEANNVSETLGRRIVEAARMAAAIHLEQLARETDRTIRQQRATFGGADLRRVTDDELSAAMAAGRAD